jgi:hypothetical protein
MRFSTLWYYYVCVPVIYFLFLYLVFMCCLHDAQEMNIRRDGRVYLSFCPHVFLESRWMDLDGTSCQQSAIECHKKLVIINFL